MVFPVCVFLLTTFFDHQKPRCQLSIGANDLPTSNFGDGSNRFEFIGSLEVHFGHLKDRELRQVELTLFLRFGNLNHPKLRTIILIIFALDIQILLE